MDWTFLLRPEGPHHHILQGDAEEVTQTLKAFGDFSEQGLMVRWLRGSRMRTTQGVLDEFAAVLQFPAYFGENWDALDECLNELEWLSGDCAALLILDADELMRDADPTETRILFDILSADTSDVALHLLYQVEADAGTLQEELKAMGVEADLHEF